MTIKKALFWANKKLKSKNINSPILDAEVLLAFVLKKTKAFLYAHPEKKLAKKQTEKYKKYINRRAKHEPVAYITGKKEFFGFDFLVNKNVLIPRPETENLVSEVINFINRQTSQPANQPTGILDVGSGSGCIIISLSKLLPKNIRLLTTEISGPALKTAQKNAKLHNVEKRIKFIKGNLLKPIINNPPKPLPDNLIIIANLPYLMTKQWQNTQPEIKKYEPRMALDGGKDGLDYYGQIMPQIAKLNKKIKNINCFFEIDPAQGKKIKKLAKNNFAKSKIKIKKDLCGRQRMAIVNIK